jgi:hypothetical protein
MVALTKRGKKSAGGMAFAPSMPSLGTTSCRSITAGPTQRSLNPTRTGDVQRRAIVSLIAHASGCALFAILFLCCAMSHLSFTGSIGTITPFHSTNRYFERILDTTAVSEGLLHALSALPDERPVAVVYRVDNTGDQMLASSVAYFAWPKSVLSFPVRSETQARQLEAVSSAPVSATFFCGVTPPAGTGPIFHFGERFVFAPRTGFRP